MALGPNEYGPNRESRDSKSFLRANYSRFHNMSWSTATPKYYSFDTANARFIFLDTNVAEGAHGRRKSVKNLPKPNGLKPLWPGLAKNGKLW